MRAEFREAADVLLYMAATLTFFGCLGLSLVRRRFSMRTMLLATAAACIALAVLARS